MAIKFPVDLESYFNAGGGLKVTQRAFNLTDARTVSETKGGEAIVRTYGSPLWQGQIAVAPMHHALQRPLEALVRALMRGDASFYVGDLMDDTAPLTSITLINVPKGDEARLGGFPSGYKIPVGLRFSFNSAGSRMLHETVSAATANASGEATLTVNPPLQLGWTAGSSVAIGKAAKCRAVLRPGTLREGIAGPTTSDGFTFSWRQTMRPT